MTGHAIDFIKQKREQPFFLYLSYFHVHTPVRAPTDWLVKKYQKRAAADTGDEILRTHYGAFIETLDAYVGQVLTALDQQGLRESTLVVFTSDNGGHPEYADNAPLRGSKWNLYEAGIRVPLLVRWPQHVQAGSGCTKPVSGIDLLPLFHGATAAWPERALTWHFPYYHPEKGYTKAKETIEINDFIVSKTKPVSAIRRGDWKLLQFYETEQSELYDLSKDPSEQRNLSSTHPKQAAELQSVLKQKLQAQRARYPVAAKAE